LNSFLLLPLLFFLCFLFHLLSLQRLVRLRAVLFFEGLLIRRSARVGLAEDAVAEEGGPVRLFRSIVIIIIVIIFGRRREREQAVVGVEAGKGKARRQGRAIPDQVAEGRQGRRRARRRPRFH
jgi:hypothetical protein